MPIYECMCLFMYMHLRQPLVILFGCKLLVVLSLVPKPNNMVQHMNTADYGHDLDKFWFCESETGHAFQIYWLSGVRGAGSRNSGGLIGIYWNHVAGGGGGPGGVVGARRGLLEHSRAGGGASSLSLRSHQLGWLGGGKVHADLSSTREFIGNACKTLVQPVKYLSQGAPKGHLQIVRAESLPQPLDNTRSGV